MLQFLTPSQHFGNVSLGRRTDQPSDAFGRTDGRPAWRWRFSWAHFSCLGLVWATYQKLVPIHHLQIGIFNLAAQPLQAHGIRVQSPGIAQAHLTALAGHLYI